MPDEEHWKPMLFSPIVVEVVPKLDPKSDGYVFLRKEVYCALRMPLLAGFRFNFRYVRLSS